MRNILLASVAAVVGYDNHPITVRVMDAKGNGPFTVNLDDYTADQSENGGAPKWTLAPNEVSPEGKASNNVAAVVSPDASLVIPPAPSAPAGLTAAPATVAVNELLVEMKGTGNKAKFLVVYPDKTPATGLLGIDENGYKTDSEAWAAVLHFKQNIKPATPLENMPDAEAMQTARDGAQDS